MRYELKRLGFWSVIKVTFILYGILGFILGIFYALFLAFFASLAEYAGGQDFPAIFSGALLIFVPIFIAFIVAIGGVIQNGVLVGLYNLFVRAIGGIEVTLASLEPATGAPAVGTAPVTYTFTPTQPPSPGQPPPMSAV